MRQFGHCLGEDHVGARGHICLRAIDGGLQALAGQRIGARHDDEMRVGARIHGGLDAVHHFRGGDEFLARAVAAAFGAHLVLDVHRRRARFDHGADGARNVERASPAGVDVH